MQKFDESWGDLVETVQTALKEAKQGEYSPGGGADPHTTHDSRLTTQCDREIAEQALHGQPSIQGSNDLHQSLSQSLRGDSLWVRRSQRPPS